MVEQYLIVKRLMELYGYNHFDYRYMYINKDGEPAYTDPHHELTYPDLYEHLDGKKTVSVYGRKYHTKFMTLDVDEAEKSAVFLLINKMVELGIPRDKIYVSVSGNKGYHLDVFFDKGVLKSAVESLFKYLWRDPAVRQIAVECFPLYHNTIKIPLGVNMKTGRRCWYADTDTLEPYEGDYEFIMRIEPMSAEEFEAVVYKCNKEAWHEDLNVAIENSKKPMKKKQKSQDPRNIYQPNGEPVITMPGQRNRLMCKKAVYLRCVGADEDTIYEELMKWIDRQDPNLIRSSRKEIEDDAARIARDVAKKYEVRIQEQPGELNKPDVHETYLTDGDIKQILRATTKMARRVAFLMCVYCRRYGACILGYKRIEEIIGAKDKAAYRAIKLLESLGIISQESQGGMTRVNGNPVLRANKYLFNSGEEEKKSARVSFVLEDVEHDFEKVFYRIIRKACDDKTIKQHFTGTEVKRIMEGKANDD